MNREATLIEQVRMALEEPPASIRLSLGKEQVRALVVLLLAAVAVSVGFFLVSRAHSETIVPAEVVTPAASEIIVDVAGRVRNPGVYHLPQGSRAIDALNQAGGALPDVSTDNINLAHVLSDGEQILVGLQDQKSGRININSASVSELDSLPGVGPVMAQRIVTWRQSHGRFRSVEQIKDVPGVGAATFANLKDLIRI